MTDDLTPTQGEVWEVVAAFLRTRRIVGPTDLAAFLHRDVSTVHYHLQRLTEAGRLEHVPSGKTGRRGKYRRV